MNEPQNGGVTENDLELSGRTSAAESAPTIVTPLGAIDTATGEAVASGLEATLVAPVVDPEEAIATQIVPPVDEQATAVLKGGVLGAPDHGASRAYPKVDATQVSVKGYQILGELGRGGMGVVYRARQTALNRLVALKMILVGGHAGSEQLARFRAEAEAVAQLQHPNIVQVYDIGEQDSLPYFSLEFVDGRALDKELAGKPQPESKAAQLIETLARAMHYAHERSIIHRDLKPANVLLTKTGLPKISDFGLAKQLESDSSKTRTGTIMGTPSYMAPEQGRGEKQVGPLADVYALGSMLYEMITGRPPFLAPTALDTLMRLLNEEPLPPSRLQSRVSRDLETICLKCLQKDVRRRYASAAELADDLKRFQAGEPIHARPVGRLERAWRWCKRNSRVAALSGAVVILVIAVGIALSIMGLRMARDREALVETRKQARQRLDQATEAMQAGNFARAQDLLQWSDPLLISSTGLSDLRGQLDELRSQVAVFAEFRKLLDDARYLGLFGSQAMLPKAQKNCRELLTLYDNIEQRERQGSHGWPPLNARQQELLKEDVFEAFLIAALVERNASLATEDEAGLEKSTRQAIEWLNRAEKLLPPTKALFARRGGYYEILGEKKAAEAEFQQASKIEPTSAVDRFWHGFADYKRAEKARQERDLKSAGEYFRKAVAGFASVVEMRPENFWAYFTWAECHTQLGNNYDALLGFTTCIQLRPDAPWSYNNRGTVHLQLREYDLAIQDYNAALQLDDQYAEAYQGRGQARLLMGKPDVADFSKAVELRPKDFGAYLRRAAFYRTQRDFQKAREDYSVAINLQPKDADAYRSRAVVSLLGKKLDESFADWQELVKLQPANPEPHYYLGVIHLGCQQFDLAAAELQTAIKMKADYASAYLARAIVLRWQGKSDDALKDVNLVVDKLVPNRHDYVIERADLYRAMGRNVEAIDDYQRCLALQPKQIDAYLGLAFVYDKQGKPDLVKDCYERMVKADPSAAMPYLHRAAFHREQRRFEEAAADCDSAARNDPQSLLPDFARAGVAAARGDYRQAVQAAEELLAKASANDGKILYAAACVWSLAAQAVQSETDTSDAAAKAGEYADRAEKLLADALEVCFHDFQYPEHNRMAYDPALKSLRQRPSVEKLLVGRR